MASVRRFSISPPLPAFLPPHPTYLEIKQTQRPRAASTALPRAAVFLDLHLRTVIIENVWSQWVYKIREGREAASGRGADGGLGIEK
jgi:hypothetical protein